MSAATMSVDEFMALEQKVLQTVELIKKEREGRAAAEAARASAEAELQASNAELSAARAELSVAQQEIAMLQQQASAAQQAETTVLALEQEREAVRMRVERMVASLDELL
jgi:hypothetical protein